MEQANETDLCFWWLLIWFYCHTHSPNSMSNLFQHCSESATKQKNTIKSISNQQTASYFCNKEKHFIYIFFGKWFCSYRIWRHWELSSPIWKCPQMVQVKGTYHCPSSSFKLSSACDFNCALSLLSMQYGLKKWHPCIHVTSFQMDPSSYPLLTSTFWRSAFVSPWWSRKDALHNLDSVLSRN